jgi:NAD kinase
MISFYPPYLIKNIFHAGRKETHIAPELALNCTMLRALLNIALNDSVLSYNEHHKHLHFNVYNGSQLNIS